VGGVSLQGDAMYFYEVCVCGRKRGFMWGCRVCRVRCECAMFITHVTHPPQPHTHPTLTPPSPLSPTSHQNQNNHQPQVYGDSQAQKDAETLAHHRSLRRSVSAALRALSPEERQFLRMKYGLDDGKSKTTR
jgi:hypothetical protein